MKTFTQLKSEIARLEAQAQTARAKEVDQVVKRIQEAIAAYELTPDLLFGRGAAAARGRVRAASKAARKGAGVAKYRDPATGKTWTGYGKPPNWIVGKNRDNFLIDPSSVVASAPKARAAGKVSAFKAAKYRDPATGKTWNGWGKPPAWIGGKNRDKFLIDGAPSSEATPSAAPDAAPAAAPAAKKSSAAKTAAKTATKAAAKKAAVKAAPVKKAAAKKVAAAPKAAASKKAAASPARKGANGAAVKKAAAKKAPKKSAAKQVAPQASPPAEASSGAMSSGAPEAPAETSAS